MNVNLLLSCRDSAILNGAVDTLNSFIADKRCKLILYDEEGNVFEPKAKISPILITYEEEVE